MPAAVNPREIPRCLEAVYLVGMTIIAVRLANARALSQQVGGQSRFADRLNMSRQQASHIIGSTPHKGIGHTMARRIEAAFEVPMGWLDQDHTLPAESAGDSVDLPHLSRVASEATDAIPRTDGEAVESIRVSKRWLRLNVAASAFVHLAIVTCRGDSMEPTMIDGSVLVIDRGVSSVVTDGVYAFAAGDEFFVKRLQRTIDGKLLVKSDNPSYDTYTINAEERAKMVVLGRALLAWTPKKL